MGVRLSGFILLIVLISREGYPWTDRLLCLVSWGSEDLTGNESLSVFKEAPRCWEALNTGQKAGTRAPGTQHLITPLSCSTNSNLCSGETVQ